MYVCIDWLHWLKSKTTLNRNEPPAGIEPATFALRERRSTD